MQLHTPHDPRMPNRVARGQVYAGMASDYAARIQFIAPAFAAWRIGGPWHARFRKHDGAWSLYVHGAGTIPVPFSFVVRWTCRALNLLTGTSQHGVDAHSKLWRSFALDVPLDACDAALEYRTTGRHVWTDHEHGGCA